MGRNRIVSPDMRRAIMCVSLGSEGTTTPDVNGSTSLRDVNTSSKKVAYYVEPDRK